MTELEKFLDDLGNDLNRRIAQFRIDACAKREKFIQPKAVRGLDDTFKRELRAVLEDKKISFARLAFDIGVSTAFLTNVLSGRRPLSKKVLVSILDTLEEDYGYDEDALFRLGLVGCQRYLKERDVDGLCTVDPKRMMGWIRAEKTYAEEIGRIQKAQIRSRMNQLGGK